MTASEWIELSFHSIAFALHKLNESKQTKTMIDLSNRIMCDSMLDWKAKQRCRISWMSVYLDENSIHNKNYFHLER